MHFHLIFSINLLLILQKIKGQDLMCCSHATGTCRSVCEKISLVQLAIDGNLKNKTMADMEQYCSKHLTSFWECLNGTFKDMSHGEYWPGRICCPLPRNENCRRACITATSSADLQQNCRHSDEILFYNCLERQNDGEKCCGQAANGCRRACMDIFRTTITPNEEQRAQVKEHCEPNHPEVMDCVRDLVKLTPAIDSHKHMPCCDKSNNSKCRETCRKLLATKNRLQQEIIDGLEFGGCGTFLPQEYFWQCFMKPIEPTTALESSRIELVGIDSAKWHCCQRATTTQCQRLCSKTYTKYWLNSWNDFHAHCLTNIHEEPLRNCLDEIDEPCELGCDGLNFCTNFNNRPTELFRSCTIQADEAARNDVALWRTQHELILPGLVLPLKNITMDNLWKTIACTLQIKPCTRLTHSNQICRDICLNILGNSVDWNQVPLAHSVDTVCTNMSPINSNVPCVQLEQFLVPSKLTNSDLITSPCKTNPCDVNEICMVVQGNGYHHTHKCISGCKLGEVSEYIVPHGTYIRIPIPNSKDGCLKICKCMNGRITNCQPLPCIPLISCLLGNRQQLHGTTFQLDCNQCACFAGELICRRKQCELGLIYSGLPCNCPNHYIPVCGRNGKTYPSVCLAKCAGLTDADIEPNACPINPCTNIKCPLGHKCIPKPQICLTLMQKSCQQYVCVNGTQNCTHNHFEPVCGQNGHEYPNLCQLVQQNVKLAYYGRCQMGCQNIGLVCGADGHTYSAECAAWANRVWVDYLGPCHTVALITTSDKSEQCPGIKCPQLGNRTCWGATPPGACCPICGGALRILYSRKQIDRASYALQEHSMDVLVLNALIDGLARQIRVAQCVVRGFLTIETDLFIMVQPYNHTNYHNNNLQLEVCVREAEKLANLINTQNPRIISELSLSALVSAEIVHTQSNVGIMLLAHNVAIITILILLVSNAI